MDNLQATHDEPGQEAVAFPQPVHYPPKYRKQDRSAAIWTRSAISLALYLALGYYIFQSFLILAIITAIVIFHELGHFLAMKYFRYNDLGIFFIPLLGAYVTGTKREVSQKESAVILLAGPLPGIILGLLLYWLDQRSAAGLYLYHVPLFKIAILLLFLNLLNLLPLYPLDGGQLLNRVFLDEEGWVSKIFIGLSALLILWVVWQSGWRWWPLLIVPVMLLLRLRNDSKITSIDKRIEAEGINADLSYEDLPDEHYWKIRDILSTEHPSFRDLTTGPPYEFSAKEEKVMMAIQALLHRHLIQDMNLAGKALIVLIWVAAFASPWLLQMDLWFFRRFYF
ncbi:MAG: site-2 protease family protein [Chitinophagaceae bacterium]